MKNNLLLSSVMLGIAVTLFSCQGNTGTTGAPGAANAAGVNGSAGTTNNASGANNPAGPANATSTNNPSGTTNAAGTNSPAPVGTANTASTNNPPGTANNSNAAPGGGNSNSSSLGQNYTGIMDFSYPSGWLRLDNPIPQYPYWVSIVYTPDKKTSVDVYNFTGVNSSDVALASIREEAAKFKQVLKYTFEGNTNGYFLYIGQNISSAGTFEWMGAFRPTSNGMAGVTIGSYNNISQVKPTILSILSTVK
jgi:hypothetical protein